MEEGAIEEGAVEEGASLTPRPPSSRPLATVDAPPSSMNSLSIGRTLPPLSFFSPTVVIFLVAFSITSLPACLIEL